MCAEQECVRVSRDRVGVSNECFHFNLKNTCILFYEHLTKIVIIFDAQIPIFTFFYSPKLVKLQKSCDKSEAKHIHENIFDPANEYSS